MVQRHYVIRGGQESQERVKILSRVMQPTTHQLFDRLDIEPGLNCLDVGCGAGDATFDLARRVGPNGQIHGTDVDPAKLELACQRATEEKLPNISFEEQDIMTHEGVAPYDLIYARFLLHHLVDPLRTLDRLRDLTRPGGRVILEDIDFTGHFCYPNSSAFWSYVDLYSKAVKQRGGDPNIGPRLPVLLHDAGYRKVEMNVVQPAGIQGEVKLISPLTMQNIADAVIDGGLESKDEVDGIIEELYEFARAPRTVLSNPRIVQVWGRLHK